MKKLVEEYNEESYSKGGASLKVNLGSGNKLLQGYINIDNTSLKFRTDTDTFICASAFDIDSMFSSNSVDEVLCSHFLEHLSHFEVTNILFRIWGVLKPEGKLVVVAPDFVRIIRRWRAKQRSGDFSDTDILHLKIFSTERETLHKTVWYEEIGIYYLTREDLFEIEKIYHPSDLEICFVAKALKEV